MSDQANLELQPNLAGFDQTLLGHYERRGIVAKALLSGLFVAATGMLFDYEIRHLHWPWFRERLAENALEGLFFGLLVWVVFSAQQRRLRRRFKEVGYLNHHIRNSLAIIEMAEGHVAEASRRLELIKEASSRITSCIEKITREEDVEISKRFPEVP